MTTQIESLHACWQQTTGQEVNLRATERIWYELSKLGFTAADLLVVLKHVMAYNKTHQDCPMKVQVLKLCGDTENFASICAEAKARERNRVKPPNPKQEILTAFRGVVPEQVGNPVVFCDVLAKLKASL